MNKETRNIPITSFRAEQSGVAESILEYEFERNKYEKDVFLQKMQELVSCKISPNEWISWWRDHREDLLSIDIDAYLYASFDEFLVKESDSSSVWKVMCHSQKLATEYLKSNKIQFELSDDYQKIYENKMAVEDGGSIYLRILVSTVFFGPPFLSFLRGGMHIIPSIILFFLWLSSLFIRGWGWLLFLPVSILGIGILFIYLWAFYS